MAIIDWISRQSWCSGAVGMRGISWGGINTLQVAAMRPKALKAIMALGTTDTRYGNDAHYVGGALGHTNLQWGIGFKAVMAGPPDPPMSALIGRPCGASGWRPPRRSWPPGWSTRPMTLIGGAARWVSIGGDPGSHLCGGRLAGHLLQSHRSDAGEAAGPRKGLIGPWGHTYPWTAEPMGLDWAYEEVRWWEQWLKGVDTGIMDEPMLRAFMPYATWAEVRPTEIPDAGWRKRSGLRRPSRRATST
uniref:Xaa-Pro dipeptidyl-peptidase-like domain-containing protein n=1 Tax=Phenylobacterium glaciei TaxID=2803784 RepID=A0A974P4U0_9CAUL|nr:hypothetical protein JKL49_07840 [Phenylobacterium glaciei]